MSVIYQVAEVFLLGAIGGAVPGPVLTAALTEVVSGGFAKSVKVIFRALCSELSIVAIFVTFVSLLAISQSLIQIISLSGAMYLIHIAKGIWKTDDIGSGKGEVFTFTRMFILTVFNGGFWIFWLTVCMPRALELKEQVVAGQYLFLLAFESGWLVVTLSIAYAFSRFRPILLRKNLVATVFKLLAAMLLFFAARSAYGALVYFINI